MINWNQIKEGLPDTETPVFLAKEPLNDFKDAIVGRMVKREEDGATGWFCSNNGAPFQLSVFPLWATLKEIDLALSESSEEELRANIPVVLQKLSFFESKFQCLAKAMMISGKGVYPLDIYISGILNRSLSLIYGFETLIKSVNFLGAAHLVRPLLDNYLRLSAAWIVSSPHDFVNEVWSGKSVKDLKDKDGRLMTDRYLKQKAAVKYPWIENVYDETSGFIHFSAKHIVNATTLSDANERSLITVISKTDNNVSIGSKLEGILCMIEICNCIAEMTFGWIETKRIDMLPSDDISDS